MYFSLRQGSLRGKKTIGAHPFAIKYYLISMRKDSKTPETEKGNELLKTMSS
jgi:hypothetical protein